MLRLTEIGPAFYGAWRLARFDVNGMRYFDSSIEGFWRSFQVAVLVAPLMVALVALDLSGMRVEAGWFRIVAGETIAYVISWVAFPLAAFYIVRLVDREDRYLGFIVAYNWSTLIQIAVLLPAAALSHRGVLPAGLGGVIALGSQIALLVYEWFIVRTALNLASIAAAGIVLIDVIISVLINGAEDLMLRATTLPG
jgi:hypothetical protein